MWISSFVIALSDDSRKSEQVLAALRSISCLHLGELQASSRLPVVLEVEDSQESRYWYDWIEHLPGVLKVDMAFATFDATEEVPEGSVSSRINSESVDA